MTLSQQLVSPAKPDVDDSGRAEAHRQVMPVDGEESGDDGQSLEEPLFDTDQEFSDDENGNGRGEEVPGQAAV